MGLFDSVRGLLGGDDSAGEEDDAGERLGVHREPTPTAFRNEAADAIGDWDELDLDYSLASLSRLDAFADRQGAVLDVMREERDPETVADIHTGYTVRAGSYYGEVLVRALDGEWIREGDRWQVRVPGADSPAVDVFEVAAHSFAEEPVFEALLREAGVEFPDDDEDEDDGGTAEATDAAAADRGSANEMAIEAMGFADFWDGYDLDFTIASLSRLDRLVETEWEADRFRGVTPGGDDMDSGMYRRLVKQLGSYYGEVLVGTLGGAWTSRDGELVVSVDGVVVPVFDVAGDALVDAASFVPHVESVAADAGLSLPPIPATGDAGDAGGATPDTSSTAGGSVEPEEAATTDGDPGAEASTGTGGETADAASAADDSEAQAHDPDVEAVAAELAAADAGDDEEGWTPASLQEAGAAFAATYPGYDLDFTAASLPRLDELVAEEYGDGAATADEQFRMDRAAEAGGYFCEVLRRSLGGEWVADPDPVVVVKGRQNEKTVDPVATATDCFDGVETFTEVYRRIQRRLSIPPRDER